MIEKEQKALLKMLALSWSEGLKVLSEDARGGIEAADIRVDFM